MDVHSILATILSLALSIGAFAGSVWLNRKVKSSLLNPLLVSVAVIISVLVLLQIPLETYEQGAEAISAMLGPATAVLAYSIYQQRRVLKSHFLPVMLGCLAGSITSMVSAYALCQLLGLGDQVALSTLPKSTTAPHSALHYRRARRHRIHHYGGRHHHRRAWCNPFAHTG